VRYLDLDPADSKLLALADNKTAEIADWDTEKLEQVMQEILDEGLTLEGLGWTDDELQDIVQELKDEEVKEDEVPEADEEAEPDSKPGELYELGPHLLVCGDWRDTELRESAYQRLRPTAGIHDPPYGINAVGVKNGEKKGTTGGGGPVGGKKKGGKFIEAKKYLPIYEDDKPFDPTELLNVLPESILWGANHFSSLLKDTRGWIVWDKKCQEWVNNFSDGELAWSPYDKTLKIYRYLWSGLARQGDKKIEYDRVHPTQKPVGLIAKVIQDYLSDHETLADFFLGSGTTLIACAEVHKNCVGFEIEPSYCDVIRRRWTRYAKENNLEAGAGALDG
jgi:hypothetical protein